MGLLTILLYGVGICVVGIFSIFLFFTFQTKRQRKYFKRLGIPFYESAFSNIVSMLRGKVGLVDLELQMYKECCEKSKPLIGASDATGPMFYVTDVELMKHIYVKDFDHFVNRRPLSTVDTDKFSKMLISMEGDEWKAMRSKLSPSFTTGKIRRMFDMFDRSSVRMCNYLEKYLDKNGSDFDICKVYSKYAMDVIASSAFGIDSKCFDTSNPDEQPIFEQMGKKFQLNFTLKVLAKFILVSLLPKVAKLLNLQTFDGDSQEYFTSVITEVMKRRKETGQRQEDFLQLMMDAQEGLQKSEENSKEVLEVMTGSQAEGDSNSKNVFGSSTTANKLTIDDDQIIANCELFLLAGFDTLQSLLIYSTFALAKEQDVQEKLFQEVEKSMQENGGKLTYDAINQMSYLDLFINETLRMYAPSTRTERVCTKDFKVPGTNWTIEKGRVIVIPIYALHHDKEHYKNPEKFEPERFLNERKSERHPYAFAPFGHGPRNCIGMRFALTEVKALICHMVHRFQLEPCSKTDIPPKFTNSPSLKPANGMWLKIQPRVRVQSEQ